MTRIRTSLIALTAASVLLLVSCGGFTLSKSVSYGPISITAPAGTYIYQQDVNFRNEAGSDVDRLSSFKILRLELTIDLSGDTLPDDDWTWVGGGSITLTNPDVNGGNPLVVASVPDQSGNTTQTLVVDVTDQELIGYAQSTNTTTVETSLTVTGATDGQIDVNGSVKVRFTIG